MVVDAKTKGQRKDEEALHRGRHVEEEPTETPDGAGEPGRTPGAKGNISKGVTKRLG